MAISSILVRRLSSSTRPISSLISSNRLTNQILPISRFNFDNTNSVSSSSPSNLGFLGVFSSRVFSVMAQKENSGIIRILDAEIKCAEDCDDQNRREEIPSRFPFEIKDFPGTNTISLYRDYHGEAVKVIISMPNLVTGDNDDDVPRDRQGSSQSCLPLLVSVSKGEGISLEFSCTAYPDEICIDSMVVKEANQEDEELAYEGPDFHDLDENLQKAFHKYLEIRGISPGTTNYLHEYMINKDSREYMMWLRNVKSFIQE